MPVNNTTLPDQAVFAAALEQSATQHKHLCPRQVLGVRLGLYALRLLGFCIDHPFNNSRRQLLTIVETDGCGADGISAAVDCTIGHRTLRVEDYGKLAACVVDIPTSRALRVRPHPEARSRALKHPVEARSRWHHYLYAYQQMPDEDLFEAQMVILKAPVATLISRPRVRVICAGCAEEITNEREILRRDQPYCKACSGSSYYSSGGF